MKPKSGLEEWKRRIEAGDEEAPSVAQKPTEEMSPEELDEAIDEAKRTLLNAQRAELAKPASEEQGQRTYWVFKPRPYWR